MNTSTKTIIGFAHSNRKVARTYGIFFRLYSTDKRLVNTGKNVGFRVFFVYK